MAKKAAMLGTDHTCPMQVPATKTVKHCFSKDTVETFMVPHVGGPVVGTVSGNVKINNKLAARCGDNGSCEAEPKFDMITTGAKSVKINNRVAAAIDSRTAHGGTVTHTEAKPASKNVAYGGPFGGVTFGNSAKATEACKAAMKNRVKYKEKDGFGADIPENQRNGQQGKPMNCGQESIRNACIQRCQEKKLPPDKLAMACKACDAKEEAWYKAYLAETREQHNATTQAENDQTTKKNDELWDEAVKKSKDWLGNFIVCPVSGHTDKRVDVATRWNPYQGQTLYFWSGTGTMQNGKPTATPYFEKLGELIVDPADKAAADAQVTRGQLGSNDKTRAALLKKWCGVESREGENTVGGLANDLADGKTVIASVDVGVMAGQGPQGRHAIIVSEMEFGDDGKLRSVTVNDTSRASQSCGYKVAGSPAIANFQKSLIEGAKTSAY